MNRIIIPVLIMLSLISINILNATTKGEKTMKKYICIIYSSKTGSTAEIAEYMKNTIIEKDYQVDLKKVSDPIDLKQYQAIIIGSPIYMGQWNKDASTFIEQHQTDLKKMPLAYFSVGMSFDKKDKKSLDQIEKYLEKERSMVNPICEGRFLGRIDFSKLNFFQKLISKMVGAKEEDKRDWKAIKNWTEDYLKLIN